MKLKRCPFCNSHNLTLEVTIATYQIKCLECFSLGPQSTQLFRAAQFWNGDYEHQNLSALIACVNKPSNRNDMKDIE